MRVGLVSPYSLTVPGGVQGQILGLARSLRGLGHETRVLGPCDGPPPETGVTPLGASIPLGANGSVAPIAPDIACTLRTMRVLWDEDFDVLHLHEPIVPGPTQTATYLQTAPLLGTFHAAGQSKSYELIAPALRWLARRLALRVAVSADAVSLAAEALGGSYVVLNNGVEVERYVKATPWATEAPTVFFIGRHEDRKGLEVLLEALAWMPNHSRIWAAGSGPQTDELKARFAHDSRIEWLGRISDEEKAQRMAGADVFCAPSLRGESFGVVLLEAMAARTPIVASSLPGYTKVARSGRDALLVEPGDAKALGIAISDLLASPQLASELVHSGEQRAEEFSMDRLAERYVELYKSIA